MEYTLKDTDYEFSETEVKHEVIRIGKFENDLFEIEFKLTCSFGFLEFAHNFVWLNEDITTLLNQIENIGEEKHGTLSVLSPGIAFSYVKYPHKDNIYEFTIHLDTGFINSDMGTGANLGLTLMTSLDEIRIWVQALLKQEN